MTDKGLHMYRPDELCHLLHLQILLFIFNHRYCSNKCKGYSQEDEYDFFFNERFKDIKYLTL